MINSSIQPITDSQFNKFRSLIYKKAGISLSPQKKMLVEGRLSKRLNYYNLNNFGDYFTLLNRPNKKAELQIMVDLLTTNETYFFREPEHFEFIRKELSSTFKRGGINAWSAACSSGEEVYTLAMLFAENLVNRPWKILGSDISQRMLENCRRAIYPEYRTDKIPPELYKKYCLRGIKDQSGWLLIDRPIREKCSFRHINLIQPLPILGKFHFVFLRNVMIYFDSKTKRQVVHSIKNSLVPGGFLIVSHSESLHGFSSGLTMIKPSVYQKNEKLS